MRSSCKPAVYLTPWTDVPEGTKQQLMLEVARRRDWPAPGCGVPPPTLVYPHSALTRYAPPELDVARACETELERSDATVQEAFAKRTTFGAVTDFDRHTYQTRLAKEARKKPCDCRCG